MLETAKRSENPKGGKGFRTSVVRTLRRNAETGRATRIWYLETRFDEADLAEWVGTFHLNVEAHERTSSLLVLRSFQVRVSKSEISGAVARNGFQKHDFDEAIREGLGALQTKGSRGRVPAVS